ncbi:fungal zn(2)-Cys(6) binuclear cluster domain-containing protein [Sarocladium implicatum]|nr:fungal zn(2)-Cys(6) binuclear cluster domain-containing protein [Sarocladium implicatum]
MAPQTNARAASDAAASSPTHALATPSMRIQTPRESAVMGTPRQESRKRRRLSSNNIGTKVGADATWENLASPASDDTSAALNPRRASKISRACDNCKRRKAKCTGTLPCPKCVDKGVKCVYEAHYSRGRPRTPPPSTIHSAVTTGSLGYQEPPRPFREPEALVESRATAGQPFDRNGSVSRASPALGVAEIEGQVFDPTSGMTFLHRAWKRLSKDGRSDPIPHRVTHLSIEQQHIMLAGDRPLPKTTEANLDRLTLPSHEDLVSLIALYFDVCIATYRLLHRPSVEDWLYMVENNVRLGKPAWTGLGKSKTAIVLACFRTELSQGQPNSKRLDPAYSASMEDLMDGQNSGYSLLDEWHTTDWLDLDSSAFGPYMDADASVWMPDMDLNGTTL